MDFCCGASKVGAIQMYKHKNVSVSHVPVLYCPVCKDVEPHPKIKENLNFIVDMAIDDNIHELDLEYYLDLKEYEDLFENCSTVQNDGKGSVMKSQIDISLDLLSFARQIKDIEWEKTLKRRLEILSKQVNVSKHK